MSDVKLACGWCQCVGEQRLEQPVARGFGVRQTGFKPIASRHQVIQCRNDTPLFRSGRERDSK